MIKRPLNTRFREAVLGSVKTTTIRASRWPVGVPIMLYSWADKPYRSKQVDLAAVEVVSVWPFDIMHLSNGAVIYDYGVDPDLLRETEGFASCDEMDAWFRGVVKPGETKNLWLHTFRLVSGPGGLGGPDVSQTKA